MPAKYNLCLRGWGGGWGWGVEGIVLNIHWKELRNLLLGDTSQGRGSGERENSSDSTIKTCKYTLVCIFLVDTKLPFIKFIIVGIFIVNVRKGWTFDCPTWDHLQGTKSELNLSYACMVLTHYCYLAQSLKLVTTAIVNCLDPFLVMAKKYLYR